MKYEPSILVQYLLKSEKVCVCNKRLSSSAANSFWEPERAWNEDQSEVFDSLKPNKLGLTLESVSSETAQKRGREHKKLTMEESGRLTLLPRIQFQEICSLKPKRNEVELFGRTSYKTYGHDGICTHELALVKCLIDTPAGLGIVKKSLFHTTWASRIKR